MRLSAHELAARRSARRRRERRRRRRRVLVSILLPLSLVAVALVVFGAVRGEDDTPSAGPSSPLPEPAPAARRPPPGVVIARVGSVDVLLPVEPQRITAILFRPIDSPTAIAFEPTDAVDYETASRDGRAGPRTGGLDVGAAAGTPVYAPVDGVVVGRVPFVVSGSEEGYELVIQPSAAAGALLRLTHLDPAPGVREMGVGDAVSAGVTVVGQVRDFARVAEQELADYTADAGNHVHLEMVRTPSDLVP